MTIEYQNTDIAFFLLILLLCWDVKIKPIKQIELDWNVSYVGRQFLDNTSQKYRSISPYSFQNVSMQWNPKVKFTKKCTLGISIQYFQLLIQRQRIYLFIQIWNVITENFLYPQAGRHGYLTITVEL